jgi:PAS domain S-box-containing protein
MSIMVRQIQKTPADRRLEQAILDSIPLGVFVLGREWQFLYLNPRAERFFEQLSGRSRDQLLGRNIWQECPEVADSTFSREYTKAAADERTFEVEIFYPTLNRWFSILAGPSQDIRCFYFRDITDRVRLNRNLRQLLEQLTEADHAASVSPDALKGLLTAFEGMSQGHAATIS